nr:MAG TPA: hypothetical protein [Caudoviricetes sp.]
MYFSVGNTKMYYSVDVNKIIRLRASRIEAKASFCQQWQNVPVHQCCCYDMPL